MSEPLPLPLRDIHLPPEPSWWPPAPGWWLLLVLFALIVWRVGKALRRRIRRQRRVRLLRDALRELQHAHPVDLQAKQLLIGYSDLLRRACRMYAPHAVALSGPDWLQFLDDGATERPFSAGPGQLLPSGPFQPSVDPEAVRELTKPVERRLRSLAEHADA